MLEHRNGRIGPARCALIALVCTLGAACGASGARERRADEPEPTRIAIPEDAGIDASIPEGWVWAQKPGWRGAFPIEPTLKNLAAPPPMEVIVTGEAVVPRVGGAFLNYFRWDSTEQRRDRKTFDDVFLASFRPQVSIESPPPVMGTFQATTEVCTSARYGGHKVVNDTELSVDMIVIVCTGAGVVLGWIGSPSRLDDVLASFTFAPHEVSAP
jgi:hypothetical protein